MKEASLETTDIFRGAFYLCMGCDLSSIHFEAKKRDIAVFGFTGKDLVKHDREYINGHALVNPVQFRQALNHLRDILFKQLREEKRAVHKKGTDVRWRYENDRTGSNRPDQRIC